MPQKKLTEKSVRKLEAPPGKQVLYWDMVMPGFGVLCSSKSATKTYVVRGSVRGRDIRKKIERVDRISLAAARLRAKEMMVNFSGGIDPRNARSSSITLREALELYLNVRQNLKPRSREEFRAVIERHLAGWCDRRLRDIDRTMVEQRHRSIAAEVEQRDIMISLEAAQRHRARAERVEEHWPEAAERHRAKFNAASERKPHSGYATANLAMRAFRALWNFMAERTGDLPPNPVKLSRQWLPVAPRERLLRADDLPKFYQAVTKLPNTVARDYILLMLFSGLRRREAASLKWSDIDLRGRVIRVAAANTKANRKLDLPMADFLHDMLVARRSIGDTNWVFPADSASGYVQSPKFYFQQIAAATGIRVSPHDLRRTFITIAESTDISPIALRALVNHSLGRDVTSNYVRMTTERLREPVQRVTDQIKQLCRVKEPRGGNVSRIR